LEEESVVSSKYSQSHLLMGTIVKMDVCYEPGRKDALEPIYKEVWNRLIQIERIFSAHHPESDVFRFNQLAKGTIEVHPQMHFLFREAKNYHDLTKGTFDVTIRPLIRLWEKSQEEGDFPTEQDLEEAKKNIGFRNVHLLSGNRIQKDDDQIEVDFGGLAKGYAADEAARVFRENGIFNFHIDVGGDLYVGGYNCKGEPWRIGIRNPWDTSQIVDVVHVSNVAVTTSGNYERYYTIQGEKFSHIINPLTGLPQRDIISATVIAPSAMEADALSTSMTILKPQEVEDLIGRLAQPEQYAYFIIANDEEGRQTIHKSKNFEQYDH